MNNIYLNLLNDLRNVIVIIASIPFELTDDYIQKNLFILDAEEKERFNRYKVASKKIEFLSGRILLKTILGDILGLPPASISFIKNSYGKPFIKQDSQIDFNISHSGNKLVLAITKNKNVGVDIEKIEEDVLEVMDLVFLPDEISYINSQPSYYQRKEAFYNIWTRKEAFMKLSGKGFNLSPLEFRVPFENSERQNGNIVFQTSIQSVDYIMTVVIDKSSLVEDINFIYKEIDIMKLLN
ncbi:4'-phosphopantetheinyl transferase superfamily protein [Virgibacillus pantothenticus]|uniref:4'-phosphopantetheinyl transferase family protein n=1 Tax=Virgibacillus pantothenticus TaxID=1473 RepID=UPI001C210C85|nr:4'-phosphopantetheinyl transferase superfamily protein [Virgibacillus pantothenticus]MBU8567929.1 4'-phosphopantetheinyl transferase superfamily protein [Virgibacillus pantothenticus]MBU8601811.1 4'-phosphopantetheinyl transferase superfamily protein [Virgibacillus pantothenticus]MBU8635965.1 4'-phosphopantetheinyl transferase superfamily protein [Virgibacillus pantothenticus]MBU8643649.1 4'-phosphopantetheinyl transferase superfamily protein [Virgibacillus pantothenticus]MBU8647789.1 4'-ph